MSKAKSYDKVAAPPANSADAESGPWLPAWKAFVIQFTHDTGSVAGVFSGRAEHLSTGQIARFESPQVLVKFIEAVLQEPRAAGR